MSKKEEVFKKMEEYCIANLITNKEDEFTNIENWKIDLLQCNSLHEYIFEILKLSLNYFYTYRQCGLYKITYYSINRDFSRYLYNKKNFYKLQKSLQKDLKLKLLEMGIDDDNIFVSDYSTEGFQSTGIIFLISFESFIKQFINNLSNDSPVKISDKQLFYQYIEQNIKTLTNTLNKINPLST